MDTLEEIRANSRTIEVTDTRCGDCNQGLLNFRQIQSTEARLLRKPLLTVGEDNELRYLADKRLS